MIEFLTSDDPSWDDRLAEAPVDVYHRAGYHRFSAGAEEGEAVLAIAGTGGQGFAWPYLRRRIQNVPGFEDTGWADVHSVYGYPGPVAWGCEPGDEFVRGSWDALQAEWRRQGVIAAFTRFHPLLDNAALGRVLVPEGNGDPPIVPNGATVSIDCTLTDEQAVGSYARVLRQEVARSRREGLRTEHDEEWTEGGTFVRLYDQTMDRNRAAESYRLSVDDVRRLKGHLEPHVHLLITHLAGAVVAAGIFTEYHGIVQAHLVGTDDAYRRLSPLKVLLDDARRWARRRGNRVLHLGGGRGGREDSLFAFKARFSDRRHDFHTGRWILDRAAYDELVVNRTRDNGGRHGVAPDPSWFPAYRAPLTDPRSADSV